MGFLSTLHHKSLIDRPSGPEFCFQVSVLECIYARQDAHTQSFRVFFGAFGGFAQKQKNKSATGLFPGQSGQPDVVSGKEPYQEKQGEEKKTSKEKNFLKAAPERAAFWIVRKYWVAIKCRNRGRTRADAAAAAPR
ncbi:MAG: hypothetical protein ACQERN_03580 [Thermodesulfobacteriota bacterium]